ncbi:hypothetical protein CISG_04293 [Coccidioides immitis RMSCC 3703]|uniref:Fe2OG dioxygenase domain-containing protein n=1 Tax=Coccidioides immitis RMSCC 3703 TaxID=454286 RepID=A0A0J8QQ76_COCIT|nr:hypothetical protein CISG_04293 [Coccidioides immitis RMSCC 3703]
MTAAVNDRDSQLGAEFLDLVTQTGDEWALENLAGCESRLFRMVAQLSRLNQLSQMKPVEPNEFVEKPVATVTPPPSMLHYPTFSSPIYSREGFVPFPSDMPFNAYQVSDPRTEFWQEWRAMRQRLESWRMDPASTTAPRPTTPSHTPTSSAHFLSSSGFTSATPPATSTLAHVPQANLPDVSNISESFRYAGLLYLERLANPNIPSTHARIQNLVYGALHYITAVQSDGQNAFSKRIGRSFVRDVVIYRRIQVRGSKRITASLGRLEPSEETRKLVAQRLIELCEANGGDHEQDVPWELKEDSKLSRGQIEAFKSDLMKDLDRFAPAFIEGKVAPSASVEESASLTKLRLSLSPSQSSVPSLERVCSTSILKNLRAAIEGKRDLALFSCGGNITIVRRSTLTAPPDASRPRESPPVDIYWRSTVGAVTSAVTLPLEGGPLEPLVYSGPAGVFKNYVDSSRSPSQFGSLVVCLPSEHKGGNLVVRHNRKDINFEWAHSSVTHVQWAAFYSDCEHEIKQVTEGHRVTLTYNLYVTEPVGSSLPPRPLIDPSSSTLYAEIKTIVSQPAFFPRVSSSDQQTLNECWPCDSIPGITWVMPPKFAKLALGHMAYGDVTRYSSAAILVILPSWGDRNMEVE